MKSLSLPIPAYEKYMSYKVILSKYILNVSDPDGLPIACVSHVSVAFDNGHALESYAPFEILIPFDCRSSSIHLSLHLKPFCNQCLTVKQFILHEEFADGEFCSVSEPILVLFKDYDTEFFADSTDIDSIKREIGGWS